MKNCFLALLLSIKTIFAFAQLPTPALIGYWQNWNDANAPYIQLDQIDLRYNVIEVAFAVPEAGSDYKMIFSPDQATQQALITQIQSLQSQGRKVLISMGGATDPVSLDNISERDTFVSRMTDIISTYHFDGIDIDFEGASVSVTGGTIAAPTDAKIINLIEAVKRIMGNYYNANGRKLLLTMAPETAFVQGGMSAYGGIWGAYLPIIEALRDSIDALQVQLYNSGSMYGIDGNVYAQGSADFIVAMTEAVIQGFTTSGGSFSGLPASKVAIGLPACTNAAGGGYTDPSTVESAINYLRGNGVQPGNYSLVQTAGYPDLLGMMTWSVNWDAVNSCGPSYQYADNFETIFGAVNTVASLQNGAITFYPNPVVDRMHLELKQNSVARIYSLTGKLLSTYNLPAGSNELLLSSLKSGMYFLQVNESYTRFVKE
jgi:chitinase